MSSSSNLEYIITHVFLPPKLPQGDDSDPKQDLALIEQCRAALGAFQARLHDRERQQWLASISMLSKLLGLRNTSGDILSQKVELSLEAMKGTDVLAFHIRSQNAGLIIRQLPQHFSFESFELSPTTQAVISTKGRLRRCFPGPVVAVGQDRLANPSFREALAQLLAELDASSAIVIFSNPPFTRHPVPLLQAAKQPLNPPARCSSLIPQNHCTTSHP